MRKQAKFLGAIVALGLLGIGTAWAAGVLTNGLPVAGGSQYPFTLPLTGNELIPADTQLPSGANPQTVAVTTSALMNSTPALPRNYLSNGAINIAQQGNAASFSCGAAGSAPTELTAGADRWICDVNVTSGAGKSQQITASPAPPQGFQNSMSLFRTSGALLQPVCVMQEIETSRAVQLVGRYVELSSYMQALGALFSASGGLVNTYLIIGTGTDQGFGTMTANPAITPAWTNIAFVSAAGAATNATATPPVAASFVVPGGTAGGTASWTRFSWPAALLIPTTFAGSAVTEVGIEICFTPVGSASGATDGIALTGLQLEAVGPAITSAGTFSTISATTAASAGVGPFEFRTIQDELRDAERFFWQLNEPASLAGVPGICEAVGATSNICTLNLPVQMRGTTPVVAIPTVGTFKVNIAGTSTTWVTPTAGACSTTACEINAGNTNTAGQAELWTGGGGTGVVTVVNDKVM